MELSALFCIILDTTLNRSTFLCHKVRENGKTIVRLLCFDAIKGCKAVEIDGTPKQIGLDSVLIRGPAMDGCSTMSGIPGGLQTLVREICQTALSVHHLNLVLVMHTVQVKYLFPVWSISASRERISTFHKAQDTERKTKKTPKALSDTCWAARANAVQHTRDNFEIYVEALEELI